MSMWMEIPVMFPLPLVRFLATRPFDLTYSRQCDCLYFGWLLAFKLISLLASTDFELTPRIKITNEKKLVGQRLTMSLVNNKTGELWKSFMPRRKEITNHLTNDLISMQIYKPTHFSDFKLTNEFEKWASVEVTDFNHVPNHMETFTLSGGLYAVFDYKGSSSDSSIFQYIFGTWLPNSDYVLDNRPHFEILGSKYKNNDPTSEEEIWIPILPKQ